jgi:hypothetical protein
MTVVEPPEGLGPAGTELYRQLVSVFDFSEDPHRLSLIEELCLTKSLCCRLQSDIDAAKKLEVRGSQGQPVIMGQVSELLKARSLMATLTRSLGLPDTPELAEVKRVHLGLIRSDAAKGRKARYA